MSKKLTSFHSMEILSQNGMCDAGERLFVKEKFNLKCTSCSKAGNFSATEKSCGICSM
jgi:Zn finger protein HypA/HybF involved in hydrogenase expression